MLQAMVAYQFGCLLKDKRTGLVAAALMSIVPAGLFFAYCQYGVEFRDFEGSGLYQNFDHHVSAEGT
eukprot:1159320-Pelagomonas_calceolata.AAC.9